MGQNSNIEWTDHTFNTHWGCVKVSPACDNCYAETWAKACGFPNIWGPAAETDRRMLTDTYWAQPLKWNQAAEAAGKPARVFTSSMADVFERNDVLDPVRARLWPLIEQTPWLTWMLLTKRPQEIMRMVPPAWLERPRTNVWYGTTVENQHYAEVRVPILMRLPAANRFLSCEPLLGPVDLTNIAFKGDTDYLLDALRAEYGGRERKIGCSFGLADLADGRIGWVITGGESGKGARPAHPDWYRSLRDQCVAAGRPFFFKQWGNWPPEYVANSTKAAKTALYVLPSGTSQPARVGARPAGAVTVQNVGKKAAGRQLDGRTHDEYPTVAVGATS